MAARRETESYNWRLKSKLASEVQLHLCGLRFTLDKELLASKSSKVANLLQKNPQMDLSLALRDIPADQESMELLGRFCHGFEVNLTPENIARVTSIAHYLGMTDSHCANNLLSKAIAFLDHHILPSWTNSIKVLKSAEHVFEQAIELGLVEYCADSVLKMAADDPRLLGEPITVLNSDSDSNDKEIVYKPNARRNLFDLDWKSENLTTLPLRLYVPIIRAIAQRSIPQEYIVANLYQYAKKCMFLSEVIGDGAVVYKGSSQREIVEALESLLPDQRGVVPCSFLFEMLKAAITLDANGECKKGLEIRIGKQLDQARVEDLLIPCQGYAKDERYDTESVRRILENFYRNYTNRDPDSLNIVAELIENFLAEISSDVDLKMGTFLAIAKMVVASSGTQRRSDGIYKAIDVYLDKHGHLTESEKEELCTVLDCNKLSTEACQHAAQNKRLPIRLLLQVLFESQMRLREAIPEEVEGCSGRLMFAEVAGEEGGVKEEMKRIESKVMELERECDVMKKEIENGGKRKKESLWKAVKSKLGCGGARMDDPNCHEKMKKIHPG